MTAIARRLGPIVAMTLAAILVSACIVDTTGPSPSPSPSPSAEDTGAPSAINSATVKSLYLNDGPKSPCSSLPR